VARIEHRGDATPFLPEKKTMELASTAFREAVLALLERPVPVVATVHAHRHPFTDSLKRRPSVTVLQLTRSNRDELPAAIARRL